MEISTRLIDKIERTPNSASFRFERPEGADFTAGQYFILTIKVNGEHASKPFSFSSSPTEKDHLEFTKKFTESDFSKALKGLQKGDMVDIKMPFGKFTLEQARGEKVAFLSGGIGITPVRSICKYATDKELTTDIVLLYGNQTQRDIAFRQDLEDMQKLNGRLKVVHTLTCPVDEAGCWNGNCGIIDEEMVKRDIPDIEERTFYVCGPPGMVDCLMNVLKDKLAIPEERVVVEQFMGYKDKAQKKEA